MTWFRSPLSGRTAPNVTAMTTLLTLLGTASLLLTVQPALRRPPLIHIVSNTFCGLEAVRYSFLLQSFSGVSATWSLTAMGAFFYRGTQSASAG